MSYLLWFGALLLLEGPSPWWNAGFYMILSAIYCDVAMSDVVCCLWCKVRLLALAGAVTVVIRRGEYAILWTGLLVGLYECYMMCISHMVLPWCYLV